MGLDFNIQDREIWIREVWCRHCAVVTLYFVVEIVVTIKLLDFGNENRVNSKFTASGPLVK